MARDDGGTGEPETALGRCGVPGEVIDRIVDLLDASDDLRTQSARRLLQRRVARLTGRAVHLPDFEFSRDWVIGFVEGYAELDGGLSALSEAVAFQRPGSPLLRELRRLVAGAGIDHTELVLPPSEAHVPVPLPAVQSLAEPGPSADQVPLAAPEPLEPREIAELARVFTDRLAVTSLLTRAGIPPARVPEWGGRDPAAYWLEVSDLLGGGLLVDGRRRLLAAAAGTLPANPVFAGRGPA